MFWGISTGTLLFIVILIISPVLMGKINTRSYFKNLFQGVISSFIFFLSQSLYEYCERISKFYLRVTLMGVSIITLILIGIVAGIYKNEADQVEFRTSFVASITAGLIFSVTATYLVMGPLAYCQFPTENNDSTVTFVLFNLNIHFNSSGRSINIHRDTLNWTDNEVDFLSYYN